MLNMWNTNSLFKLIIDFDLLLQIVWRSLYIFKDDEYKEEEDENRIESQRQGE